MEGCTLDFDELIDDTVMVTKEDEFQRSLLEVKLVDKSTAKKQEAFQGSLLPAIITLYDVKATDTTVEHQ